MLPKQINSIFVIANRKSGKSKAYSYMYLFFYYKSTQKIRYFVYLCVTKSGIGMKNVQIKAAFLRMHHKPTGYRICLKSKTENYLFMKAFKKILASVAIIGATAFSANAQYYELINQATNMFQTAFAGGARYRGMVDAAYISGIGSKKANFLEISTTQGVKYGSIFFMGIGLGVDFMNTDVNSGAYQPIGNNYTTSAVMIPMFTDFRLNFGSTSSTNVFIDLKLGAGFYVSDKYIQVGDGYMNSSQSFLLRPTIGARIPVSKNSPKYAVNVGVCYQLLTNSYWYNPGASNSVTLNGFGVNLGFEW